MSSNPLKKTAQEITLDARSLYLRRLVIEALDGGGRGHIGPSMSPIEALRVLYDEILRYRADDPWWQGRDRFVLSKGHGCLALYALLADKGFFPREELRNFCRSGSFLGGHPERGKVPGVEVSTGALGHGLSIGLGIALAMRVKKSDSRVFVMMGDGEINEGSVWEAAMSIAKHKLSNLTVMVDYNRIQSYGFTDEVMPLDPLAEKWRAFGFETIEVNGHDVDELRRAFSALPFNGGAPSAIICHTVKGKGIPFAENDPTWHHKSRMPVDQIEALYECFVGR